MDTAQLIMDGNKQTVILPKKFQFQGDEVYIKKIGNAVILISKENPWQSLFESLDNFSEDFMLTREQPDLDTRENLE